METVPNLRDHKRSVEMGSVNVELPWQLPIIRGIHYLKILCREYVIDRIQWLSISILLCQQQ
ncbi:hypothetical protein FH972_002237 [Carpinus fangiana]|uniref:Uncharacterized protein n=1 Tax=Carpinus fangiana TaxID=176857 RepID=A0A5N6QGL2_9ROSI|nr:hypothetical protein FH972_002237 [Carpinus fangiana]